MDSQFTMVFCSRWSRSRCLQQNCRESPQQQPDPYLSLESSREGFQPDKPSLLPSILFHLVKAQPQPRLVLTPGEASLKRENEEDGSNSGMETAICDTNGLRDEHHAHTDSHADEKPSSTNRIDHIPLPLLDRTFGS